MADTAAKEPPIAPPQQPSPETHKAPNAPVSPPPKPPEDEAAYKEYLNSYTTTHTPKAPPATVKKTGAKSYRATTGMQTSTPEAPAPASKPIKPVVVGDKSNKKPKEVKIAGTSGKGVKKIGNKGIRIEKGVEFETPAPLDYETWKALRDARKIAAEGDTGYQDYLNKHAAAKNTAAPLPYENWLAANPPTPPQPTVSTPKPSGAAPGKAPGAEVPVEHVATPEAQPETPPAEQTAIPLETEAERLNAPQPASAPTLNELPNETEGTEALELERPEPQTTAAAPRTPIRQAPSAPQQALSPEKQNQAAQKLARDKAAARKGQTKPGAQAQPKKPVAERAKESLKQFDPRAQAARMRDRVGDKIDKVGSPVKRLLNLDKIMQINKDISDLDNKLKKTTTDLKKPRRELASLERKKRKLRRKLIFLKYFARSLNLILSLVGIGEIAEIPTEAGIVSIKKSIRTVNNEINDCQKKISQNIDEEKSLITERQEKFKDKARLTQVISRQEASNDNARPAQAGRATKSAQSIPWNDPNFDKNAIANDNNQNDIQKAA